MRYERILLDLEVQRDFFYPTGRCYSKNAARVARKIRRLFKWARENRIPVISTLLRVPRGRRGPMGPMPHCIMGTDGERKLPRTALPSRLNFGLRGITDLPEDILSRYQQVIFEKRHTDIMVHPRIERLVTELEPATFVICGAGVTQGVVQAALGLRSRGFGVILASDAVIALGDGDVEMAILRMEAKGVILRPTRRIIQPVRRPTRRRMFRSVAVLGGRHA